MSSIVGLCMEAILDFSWAVTFSIQNGILIPVKMTSWHYNTSCQKVGAHFYEKWGYLFLPTNMTISWGHGLWTLDGIFLNIPKIFDDFCADRLNTFCSILGYFCWHYLLFSNFVTVILHSLLSHFFCKKAKIFIHFTKFSLWVWDNVLDCGIFGI